MCLKINGIPKVLKVLRTLNVDRLVDKDDKGILDGIAKITFKSSEQCQSLSESDMPECLNETNILSSLATIIVVELPLVLEDGTTFTEITIEWMDFLDKIGIGHPQTAVPT